MSDELKTRLNEVSEKYYSLVADTENIDTMLEEFDNTMHSMVNIIKDFFSSGCGEGECIKKLYESVSDGFSPNVAKKVELEDINLSVHLFEEYTIGMQDFISRQISDKLMTESVEEAEKRTEMIRGFMEKDELFVESLFDGGVNTKTVSISPEDALCNLEVLIQFIPAVKEDIEYIHSIWEKRKLFGPTESVSPAMVLIVKMYTKSIVRYVGKTILHIFSSYEKTAECCMRRGTGLPNLAPAKSSPVIKPTLQLL